MCACAQEKAQCGGMEATSGVPQSSPDEPADESMADESEAGRLLDWPQLELERVNSFLTSRLEEIKNTIKDSIRASFSMYDLNLDVNDFPKKAATLEGNHLLSHLNGSTDIQQIDLDLAPLSLGTFKNHLDLVNGWEDAGAVLSSTTSTTAEGAAGQKDVQRLQTPSTLSKLSRVHSPERGAAVAAAATAAAAAMSESHAQGLPQATAKSKEDYSETRNTTAGAAKSKKNRKQQQQRQEQAAVAEQSSIKPTKALPAGETQKSNESRVAEASSGGSKVGSRQQQQQQQPQQLAESQRNGPRKAEEGRPTRQAANGAAGGLPHAQRAKGDTELRAGRSELDSDGKTHPGPQQNTQQQQQQSKGRNKKNKNKGEKSSSAIGKYFVLPPIYYIYILTLSEM